MICPYCKEEMDKGFVQSGRKIFWSDKKRKVFFYPDSSKGDITIAKGMSGCIKEAYFCKNCKRITIDLTND